jgi:hypothetical protein
MSIEKPSIQHELAEVYVVRQRRLRQVIFVCRCATAFKLISEFRAHKTLALRESIGKSHPSQKTHPPAWKKIDDIAFASDAEILDELRCWNELDGALREIAAQQNKLE